MEYAHSKPTFHRSSYPSCFFLMLNCTADHMGNNTAQYFAMLNIVFAA